jgi:hypothetical protein
MVQSSQLRLFNDELAGHKPQDNDDVYNQGHDDDRYRDAPLNISLAEGRRWRHVWVSHVAVGRQDGPPLKDG